MKPTGTEAAGCPVTFHGTVNGTMSEAPIVAPTTLRPSNRSTGQGGVGIVGVSSTSKSANTSPVRAAKFLEEFAGDGPWAHVDMAGPGFLERSRGDYLLQPGGTGYGVRLIAALAESLA